MCFVPTVNTEGRAMLRLSPWLVEHHVLLLCGLQGLVQAPPAGPAWLADPNVPFHVHLADSP